MNIGIVSNIALSSWPEPVDQLLAKVISLAAFLVSSKPNGVHELSIDGDFLAIKVNQS